MFSQRHTAVMGAAPGEGLATVGADVGLLDAALMGAHVVAHAVLPLEALLADGTGEGLLVRVGQAVAVEVVDVPEGLAARLARVVLPHRVGVGVGGPLRAGSNQSKNKAGQLQMLTGGIPNILTALCNMHADIRAPISTFLHSWFASRVRFDAVGLGRACTTFASQTTCRGARGWEGGGGEGILLARCFFTNARYQNGTQPVTEDITF